MNNLNNPPGRNTRPGEQGDGGSNKWIYALLVPPLSFVAFRWFYNSQKKVQQTKDQYDKDMKIAINKLEKKHQENLTEYRRKVAHLELELKKERHHVQQAMASMKDKDWEIEAMTLLNELEEGLMERQDAYCSQVFPHVQLMEKKLLDKVAKTPLAQTLNMEGDLRNIFLRDCYCVEFKHPDGRRNGSLMWVYLNNWKQRVAQQKEQKRAKRSMGATQPGQNPAGSRKRT